MGGNVVLSGDERSTGRWFNTAATTTDRAYGTVNSAGPSRNIQFGLKLSF